MSHIGRIFPAHVCFKCQSATDLHSIRNFGVACSNCCARIIEDVMAPLDWGRAERMKSMKLLRMYRRVARMKLLKDNRSVV
jgi:hypothetical protein